MFRRRFETLQIHEHHFSVFLLEDRTSDSFKYKNKHTDKVPWLMIVVVYIKQFILANRSWTLNWMLPFICDETKTKSEQTRKKPKLETNVPTNETVLQLNINETKTILELF